MAPIEYHREIAAPEVRYTRARTDRRVKATLPAPYIIGRRMWHPEHSRAAYPTREKLMRDCVGVLRREIEAVRAAGADTVQLDEPWLATLVDPKFRAEEGIGDVRYEMDLCADLLNQTLDGLGGIETSVHLCHAHFARQHKTEGSYDLIMPALARVRAGTISLELATPAAGGLASLARFPAAPRLGLGCIDHCDRRIETVDEVIGAGRGRDAPRRQGAHRAPPGLRLRPLGPEPDGPRRGLREAQGHGPGRRAAPRAARLEPIRTVRRRAEPSHAGRSAPLSLATGRARHGRS